MMAQEIMKHTMSHSIINITKIQNKILADRSQQYIQRTIPCDQGRFIPGILLEKLLID